MSKSDTPTQQLDIALCSGSSTGSRRSSSCSADLSGGGVSRARDFDTYYIALRVSQRDGSQRLQTNAYAPVGVSSSSNDCFSSSRQEEPQRPYAHGVMQNGLADSHGEYAWDVIQMIIDWRIT